jgi:predicted LPLAT superfamily acyltransferase
MYLRRSLGREPGWRDLYRHLHFFASTIHDRIYLINDRFDLFDIEVVGGELVTDLLATGRGALPCDTACIQFCARAHPPGTTWRW